MKPTAEEYTISSELLRDLLSEYEAWMNRTPNSPKPEAHAYRYCRERIDGLQRRREWYLRQKENEQN